MRAGELRHRVSIETSVETSDGHDGFSQAWETVKARIPARVLALSGRDLISARQIDPRASHEVRLRFWRDYVTDLANGRARLIWHDGYTGDRTLEIVERPRETVARRQLDMTCKEDAA